MRLLVPTCPLRTASSLQNEILARNMLAFTNSTCFTFCCSFWLHLVCPRPQDYSPPGFSVTGLLAIRPRSAGGCISQGSSQPWVNPCPVSRGGFFTPEPPWATLLHLLLTEVFHPTVRWQPIALPELLSKLKLFRYLAKPIFPAA